GASWAWRSAAVAGRLARPRASEPPELAPYAHPSHQAAHHEVPGASSDAFGIARGQRLDVVDATGGTEKLGADPWWASHSDGTCCSTKVIWQSGQRYVLLYRHRPSGSWRALIAPTNSALKCSQV